MNWNKEKILRTAERVLKRTEPYLENRTDSNNPEDNFQLGYVLIKGSKTTPDTAVAYAICYDDIISFNPLEHDPKTDHAYWGFSFDSDLFHFMEQGYDLVGMSLESHCAAWSEIEEYHEYLSNPKGMQRYLDYCKRNKVTAELLRREFQYDGMDVMTLYDKKTVKTENVKAPKNYER